MTSHLIELDYNKTPPSFQMKLQEHVLSISATISPFLDAILSSSKYLKKVPYSRLSKLQHNNKKDAVLHNFRPQKYSKW